MMWSRVEAESPRYRLSLTRWRSSGSRHATDESFDFCEKKANVCVQCACLHHLLS